ncbi:MAG TPA: shikimate kinase [Planctomycetota bacterium]
MRSARTPSALLKSLAARVREGRARLGLSLEETAARSGLSRRFLVEIEAARTNPSIGKLAALSSALAMPLGELCDLPIQTAPRLRIALLGLRGAGKSTLGRRLAARLEVPFAELDQRIEERAGMTKSEIFELHGTAGYRRIEEEALEDWLRHHGAGVLAVPGGLVTSPRAYERLLATCRTVWLQAAAREHWDRVVAQGDMRPMRGDPAAMQRLEELLAERASWYARAGIHFQTSGHGVEASTELLAKRLLEESAGLLPATGRRGN